MAWSSGKIAVPTSLLQERASQLFDLADQNEDLFDRIYNALEIMEANREWKGESLAAALEETKKNKEKFAQTVDEMHKLAGFLKKFADEMESHDEALRIVIENIGK